MSKTAIEWATHTWNPVVGCSKVSEGCRHCYAERIHNARHKGWKEGWKDAPAQYHKPFSEVQFIRKRLGEPASWREPRRVFCCSMSDLFHEQLADSIILRILGTMELVNANRIHAGQKPHTFIVLTKRAKRMRDLVQTFVDAFTENVVEPIGLSHIWFGVSVEDHKAAEERVPYLLDIHTPVPIVRFISAEPLLGPIDLRNINDKTGLVPQGVQMDVLGGWAYPEDDPVAHQIHKLDWVIVGGETGLGARQMLPGWVALLQQQAADAAVPFFFKQWGEYNEVGLRVGRRRAGRLLDGREWNELPVVRAQIW